MIKSVSVIGLGYIGLPTAAVIAERGVRVVGVDVNPHVVDTINRGDIHIVEPMLEAAVRAAVSTGQLCAASLPLEADAFIIAVPTPITAQKKADMSFVTAAVESIAPILKRGDVVIIESTSPIGTTERVAEQLRSKRPDLTFPLRGVPTVVPDVHIAYCPERVLPGNVLVELIENDRAIGGLTPACAQRATEVYRLFVKGELVVTDARSAELCKLAENAFRDVNIAYANELANICGALDMNVWEVIRLANRHPRVNILKPGPGVGGHCIAVDPWFIAEVAPDQSPLIQAARRVNDQRPLSIIAELTEVAQSVRVSLGREPVLAFMGLAFKPNIDDLRESPALEIVELAAEARLGRLIVVEPNISKLPRFVEGLGADLVSLDAAIAAADLVCLLVDHREFSELELRLPSSCKFVSACRDVIMREKSQ